MEKTDHFSRIAAAMEYMVLHKGRQPSIRELAGHVHMSEYHFMRVFRQWAGISPKKFLQYITLEELKKNLSATRNLEELSGSVGLSAQSRVYDLFVNIEAVTPGEYREKGKNVEIRYGFHDSPFGRCLVAITDRGICGLEFIDHYDQPAPNRNDQPGIRHGDLSAPGHSDREAPNHDEREALTRKNQPEILHMDRPDLDRPPLHRLRQNWPNATFRSDQEGTGEAADLVFGKKGGRVSALVPGTRFQIKVWEALLQIPFGGLATYSDIASKIGQPGSGRAVGTAIGSNQIAYLIPCHRVIRSMGLPGGYRWGTGRKLCMIGYEKALSRSSVNA